MKNQIASKLSMASLIAGALFSAPSAEASNSNFAEIQIGASTMASMVRRSVKTNPNFCPFEISCPTSNETCVVDHYEIPNTGTFSRAGGSVSQQINSFTSLSSTKIRFTQPITVYLKTLSCAETAGCTTSVAASVSVVATLSHQNDQLCMTTESITGAPAGVAPPALDTCINLDSSKVLDVLGSSGAVSGTAFSLSSANDRIAVRTEFGVSQGSYNSARIAAWQSFVNGTLSPSPVKNWSAFLHHTLVRSTVKTRFTSQLQQQPGFQVTSPVSVGWLPLGNLGVSLNVGFEVDVSDTPCPNNIGADVSIPVLAGINSASDGVNLNGSMNHNAHDGDLFVCGLITGGIALGPLAGLLGIAVGNSVDVDFSSVNAGCSSNSNGDFSCNQQTHPQSFSLGFGQLAVASLDSVIGMAGGLSLAGPLSIPPSQQTTTNVAIVAPKFGMRGNCNHASCGTFGGVFVTGSSKICSATFSGDLLNLFEVTAPSGNSLPADYQIELRSNVTDGEIQAYTSAPYKMRATIATSNGMNTYQIGAATLLTKANQTAQCDVLNILRQIDCLEPETPIWQNPLDIWDPDWALNDRFQQVITIRDRAGRILDYALLTNVAIDMRTTRGLVQNAAIVGQLTFNVGARIVTQDVSMAVPEATGLRFSTQRQMVDRTLTRGISSTVNIDQALLPQGVASAYAELDLSVDMLQAAAR